MLFDVQTALAEILSQKPATCDSRDSRDFRGFRPPESQKASPESQKAHPESQEALRQSRVSQESQAPQSQPVQSQAPAQVLDFAPQPASRQDRPARLSVGGRPVTWTGRVVSLADWRALSPWDRDGPKGQRWCAKARAWVPDTNASRTGVKSGNREE